MALTLVRINPIQQSQSMLEDRNQISFYDQSVPQNTDQNIRNTNSPILIQSFVENFSLDRNHRE
jgi:hypothetical protein